MHRTAIGVAVLAVAAISASAALGDEIGDKIEAARAAYGHGDALRAMEAAQAIQTLLTPKLVEQFSRALPPPPAGWDASPPENQALDTIGGGLSITRGYQKGEGTLNATLLIDNPAVANILSLFQPGSPSPGGEGGWKTVNIGGQNALLRFNAPNHEGEILLATQNRAALQIEGGELADEKVLIEAAQGWNLAALKKLLGP